MHPCTIQDLPHKGAALFLETPVSLDSEPRVAPRLHQGFAARRPTLPTLPRRPTLPTLPRAEGCFRGKLKWNLGDYKDIYIYIPLFIRKYGLGHIVCIPPD